MENMFNLDKLSGIGPGVDLNEISPINKKRLLTFINEFIISTVSFLNNFSQSCERKLFQFDLKMQKLEAELCLIESKLNSIPGLQVYEPDSGRTFTNNVEKTEPTAILPPGTSTVAEGSEENKDGSELAGESEKEDENKPTPASQNPELARFFKMLHLGVPAQAVRLKMQCEGYDPNLLDQ